MLKRHNRTFNLLTAMVVHDVVDVEVYCVILGVLRKKTGGSIFIKRGHRCSVGNGI